jgi:hypothetical protein
MALSELRGQLAERVENEYADLIRQGFRKQLVLEGLSRKHCVSIAWIRRHCNIRNYEYEYGTNFNLK